MAIQSSIGPVSTRLLQGTQNETNQFMDPVVMKKAFGDKKLGQVLNELSDPNYSARKRRVEGVGSDELGKNAFF